jgi:ATP-binding cassette, subfamily C (CFTR/MRP), member 1
MVRIFDFTPLFEETIMPIVPPAGWFLAVSLRLYSLHSQPRKVLRSSLHSQKVVRFLKFCSVYHILISEQLFLMMFTSMQTALLVLYALNSSLCSRAIIAASALTLLDTLGLCLLSHLEHIRSTRPSAIINIYLLLTIPFDVVRARTLWLSGATGSLAAVVTSTLGVKIMVLITEAREKHSILLDRYQNSSLETKSGIYSRLFFWWLNKLMTIGYRRIIQNEDLYLIDDEMKSPSLLDRGQHIWKKAPQRQSRALLWSTLKATRAPLAYCIFQRLCLIGFPYAQPSLISRTVDFASNPEEPDSIRWV